MQSKVMKTIHTIWNLWYRILDFHPTENSPNHLALIFLLKYNNQQKRNNLTFLLHFFHPLIYNFCATLEWNLLHPE
jgi:hypothetical protein